MSGWGIYKKPYPELESWVVRSVSVIAVNGILEKFIFRSETPFGLWMWGFLSLKWVCLNDLYKQSQVPSRSTMLVVWASRGGAVAQFGKACFRAASRVSGHEVGIYELSSTRGWSTYQWIQPVFTRLKFSSVSLFWETANRKVGGQCCWGIDRNY